MSLDTPPRTLDPALRSARSAVFRVAYVCGEWCVKADGRWLVAFDTQREALRWLAGALLQLAAGSQ